MTDAYDQEAQAWNTCLLGSIYLPGVVKVFVDDCGRDVDEQKQKGSNQAYSEDSGRNLAKGKITIDLPSMACPEYEEWKDALAVLDPSSPTASTGPLEILHPATEERNITAIRIKNITSPPPTAKDGYRVQIDWIQYAEKPKPVKKAAKKKSSGSGVKTGPRAPGNQQPLIQPLGETPTTGLSGMDAFDAVNDEYTESWRSR